MSPYEDFGPVMAPTFTPQRSFSAPYNPQQQQYSPPQLPPVPQMPPSFINTNVQQLHNLMSPMGMNSPAIKSPSNELDLNDASTLDIYSRILLFKDDHMRDELAFSRTLSPKQRRTVHLIAQKLGVYHYSVGEGEDRYAVVTRIDPATVSTKYNPMFLLLTVTYRDNNHNNSSHASRVHLRHTCLPLSLPLLPLTS